MKVPQKLKEARAKVRAMLPKRKRMMPILCKTCGKVFRPRNYGTKYCSEPCQYKSQIKKDTKYSGLHMYLRSKNKKTGTCDFCGNVRITQWAKKKGHEYTRFKKDYHELCIPCHKKYDMTDELRARIAKGNTGITHPSRWKPVVATKDGVSTEYPSIKAAAKAIEVGRSGVSNVLSGKSKTTAGYKITYKYEGSHFAEAGE